MVYFKLNIKNINNYLLTIIIPTTINIIPFIMEYTIPDFIFCND